MAQLADMSQEAFEDFYFDVSTLEGLCEWNSALQYPF